jgi:subtilase family serine protease
LNRKFIYSGLAAGALAIGALSAIQPGASAMPAHSAAQTVHACSMHVTPNRATCFAVAVASASGKVSVNSKPLAAAYTPADIQKAYTLTGLQSGGRTVAIVDAFGYPGLESDLATYRSNYGLPACTKANGCLKILGQTGGNPPANSNPGWDLEQALDVDAVSAACPDCKIVVVESNDNQWSNLMAAVNTAAKQSGVVAISNSYGGGQFPNQPAYNHPGIAVVASSGDSGFDGGQYPAEDSNVVGVGGTSVFKDSSQRGFHENVWPGAGSGCGSNAKPTWQNGADTHCSTKAVSDISAAADPNNGGLSIYCGTVSGCGGWAQVGGTSEASPIIGAVFALSGKTKGYPAKFLYKAKKAQYRFDVTSGSNGSCGVPVCTARAGWDGPTGMGTPNGVKSF